jgi:hypothetical protein
MAQGTPAEWQNLANEIFTFLDGRSMEITEEATEYLPNSAEAIARKALRFNTGSMCQWTAFGGRLRQEGGLPVRENDARMA